jgi:hypothetical protein
VILVLIMESKIDILDKILQLQSHQNKLLKLNINNNNISNDNINNDSDREYNNVEKQIKEYCLQIGYEYNCELMQNHINSIKRYNILSKL